MDLNRFYGVACTLATPWQKLIFLIARMFFAKKTPLGALSQGTSEGPIPKRLRKEIPMDHTSPLNQGQSSCEVAAVPRDVLVLCELVQLIRAWWRAFEASLSKLDRTAAVKAHDIIVDAVILARQIARRAGVILPDFADVNWAASVPPLDRPPAVL